MHYKNGREAHNGEQIVTRDWNGTIQTGMLIDILPKASACNGTLVRLVGSCRAVSVGECFHAEDAYDAIASMMAGDQATPTPPGGWPPTEGAKDCPESGQSECGCKTATTVVSDSAP